MDESSTFGRRYSLNMAQCDPIAESTHINGSSFSWGSISTKYRNYSSLCLNNTQSSDGNNKSNASPKIKNMKIDARIAADVQSKGLASRIVKYHETGIMLNRSMSAHNLYSKPGQFPAVTLKKTNLPYRATKQELSMIRIPPPEKSSFYGNTISSLLRSSSVVGLQCKRTEDLSRENRPIIHPPPTENDMAPTRSVLDVLKEISRKRINSDDLESEETSKKYCNRASNDVVDIVSNTELAIPSSLSCQRYKRQRDCNTSHQGVQLSEAKSSPEQAKKRVCNYNNDITSSLSSSIKCKSSLHNLNQTMPTNLESCEIQKLEVHRCHDHNKNKNNTLVDMRFENLENTLKKVDAINPITPIPATPCVQDQANAGGVVPKRAVSEPFYCADREITNLVQPANKPRLTLFNKRCDDYESAEGNELCELNNMYDCAGIPFVKPKKLKRCLKNPVLERAQKSKLALMLSGLSGELYQNRDVDELDSPNENQKLQIDNHNNTNAGTSAATSALKSDNMIVSLATVTSSINVETLNASNPLNFSTIGKTNSLSPSSNKTASPLIGLKLSPPKSLPENVSNILSVDAAKSTQTQCTSGGFSLGATKTSSNSLVTTSSSNNILKDCKTITAPTGSNNIFNFGQPAQLASTSDDKTKKLPVNKQPSTRSNLLQFPAVCTAFTILTTNTKTSNSASSLTASKTFTKDSNVNAPITTSSTSSPVGGSSPFNSVTKLNNSFSFTLPSTSLPITTAQYVPIINTSSSTLTKTSIVAATTNAVTFSTTATSENLGGLMLTPSLTFNSTNKSPTDEVTTISSGGDVPSVSFNNDGNLTISPPTFGLITCSTIKAHPSTSGFPFNSNAKIQNSSSNNQNNQEGSNQPRNNAFNSNTSTLFSSQSFNTKATGRTVPIFGNTANSTENNALCSPNTTQIVDSSSVKAGTQTVSSDNNKSGVLVTPTVFGSTQFSFVSKPTATPTTNTSNVSTAPGGFSFSSAVSNSAQSGTFGVGSKSSGQPNSSNNIFGGATALTSQNKGFALSSSSTTKSENSASMFGGVVNKQSEISTPVFSFGSATSMKTPTFTFGLGNNSSGDSVITNNVSTGFTFGSSASSKGEAPTNKPFSFGSPQPVQQKQIPSVPTSNANSSNIFGLSGTTKLSQPPLFNFNLGNSTNIQSNNAPLANNIFAPPSNITTGPSDRPIRRATRRLQK